MKRKIGLLFFIVGLYLVLFSSWRFLSTSFIDKDWVVECKKNEFLAKNPGQSFNSQSCLIDYNLTLTEALQKNTVILVIGSIFIILGLGFLYKLIIAKFTNRINKKTLILNSVEVFTNISYWLVTGFFYFILQYIGKSKVNNCTIDCMFIFYIAGFVGFYSSYFYLTNNYFSKKRFFKWFLGVLVAMILGFIFAYFIPFHTNDISKIKLETFLNTEFYIGFVMLSFFTFANVITGMILKGFFYWVRIEFKN